MTPYLNLVKGVCGPGKERNPLTKRCNRKCPRTHERSKHKSFRCYKKCKSGKTRDTYTRRCKGSGLRTLSKTRSRSRSISRFYRFH